MLSSGISPTDLKSRDLISLPRRVERRTPKRGPVHLARSAGAGLSPELIDQEQTLLIVYRPEVAARRAVRLDIEIIIEQPEQSCAAKPLLRLLPPASGTDRREAH